MSECSETGGCPFSFTDESETIQNYGCLPSSYEIVFMRQEHGKTWACHSDTEKPCVGAIKYMKKEGIDSKVIDKELVTEKDDWSIYLT